MNQIYTAVTAMLPQYITKNIMFIVKRKSYEELLDELNLSIEMREKSIDVYHKNNWDRFTMYYD